MMSTTPATSFRFTVPGKPVAKGRPRFAGGGKFPRTYTPKETVNFEAKVGVHAQNAGVEVLHGPVSVSVMAVWPMKGQPRKTTPRPRVWKATKPDADNVLKSVLDGLCGVAFVDDAQVVKASVETWHGAQDEAPHTEVIVVGLP